MDTASVNDTERYFILDLNAIPMLTYRSLKKIDWAGPAGLEPLETSRAISPMKVKSNFL